MKSKSKIGKALLGLILDESGVICMIMTKVSLVTAPTVRGHLLAVITTGHISLAQLENNQCTASRYIIQNFIS